MIKRLSSLTSAAFDHPFCVVALFIFWGGNVVCVEEEVGLEAFRTSMLCCRIFCALQVPGSSSMLTSMSCALVTSSQNGECSDEFIDKDARGQ